MKHRFLILPVAFLFWCTGCGVRKKMPVVHLQQTKKKQMYDHQTNSKQGLINRSLQEPVRSAFIKKKKELKDEILVSCQKKRSMQECIREIEARIGDLPVPLMVQALSVSDGCQGQHLIVYKTELPINELKNFYDKEMELLGWSKRDSFEYEEFLFSFKRQNQSCIVSIRPSQPSWWNKQPIRLYLYLQS